MPPVDLLTLYDREERQRPFVTDAGSRLAWDGPVFRLTGAGPAPWENAVLYVAPEGREPDAQAALVERQVAHFDALGHGFEWKVFGHDGPPNLAEELAARGLHAEEVETIVVFPTSAPFDARPWPAGVTLEEVHDAAGLREVGGVNARVNGRADHADWLVRSLTEELAAAPGRLRVFVARHEGAAISIGWMRLPEGTSFASLWGGSTLDEWRQRGLYTALVAHRIAIARAHGFPFVTVDCGPRSLPILLRRGFDVLTTCTPWIREPRPAAVTSSEVAG